jgi:hypothetical protein
MLPWPQQSLRSWYTATHASLILTPPPLNPATKVTVKQLMRSKHAGDFWLIVGWDSLWSFLEHWITL